MLAQVCHKEFFERKPHEYQEVHSPALLLYCSRTVSDCVKGFVIHGHHSSVTIWYCKFPNQYLADISRYGRKWQDHQLRSYNQRRFEGPKVRLHRTKTFSLRVTSERLELFTVIARLLYYLRSGQARVGYLYNYDENPVHGIVHSSCH